MGWREVEWNGGWVDESEAAEKTKTSVRAKVFSLDEKASHNSREKNFPIQLI